MKKSLAFLAFLFAAGASATANSDPRPLADPAPPAVMQQSAPAPIAQQASAGSSRTSSDESQFFNREVRMLFRIVACAGDEPIPAELEPVVAKHCRAFQPTILGYKKKYLPKAQPFLLSLQPPNLPQTVVYPFGGGDLLSALTTYPDLAELTTISLEHAGDPRGIVDVSPKALDDALQHVRRRVSGLLIWTESTSENMIQLQRGGIPGQLAFFLVGLAVHDQEPLSLRFFKVDRNGALLGISARDIEDRSTSVAVKLNPWWKTPDFSDAFSNSEITFRPAGRAGGPPRVHRHIAADLSDEGLAKEPGVLKHLQAKGRVTAMTKAASYLLWSQPFGRICSYLLSNMEFMLSDSTGIPPRLAKRAGFNVVAYGRFEGPFLTAPVLGTRDMQILFASQPERELKFRYGYPDSARNDHLVMMQRRDPRQASN
jgi:hypothetical protein